MEGVHFSGQAQGPALHIEVAGGGGVRCSLEEPGAGATTLILILTEVVSERVAVGARVVSSSLKGSGLHSHLNLMAWTPRSVAPGEAVQLGNCRRNRAEGRGRKV